MEIAVMHQRVRDARVGHLVTVTANGRPHVVPCCHALADEVIYSAVDAKPKSTFALRRLANVRANPAVALLIDEYHEDWSALWWVRLDGTGRVIEHSAERDHALDLLIEKYEQYQHEPPPGSVLAIDITAWRAWP